MLTPKFSSASGWADRLYMVNHVLDSKDIDPESIGSRLSKFSMNIYWRNERPES